MSDPDELARRYMAAKDQTQDSIPTNQPLAPVTQLPHVQPLPIPLPIPIVPDVPVAPVVTNVTVPPLSELAEQSKSPLISKNAAKVILYSPLFRILVVFFLVVAMLVIIKPSFVEDSSQRTNPLEDAPISYKRVLVVAGLATTIVVVLPIIIEHQARISSIFGKVRDMVPSLPQ